MKEALSQVIRGFESGAIRESEAIAEIRDLTGRKIDEDWLRNYWRSEPTEDFVDRLCAKPIDDWETMDDAKAVELIAEYVVGESPGRRDSIETALSRRYRKSEGFLSGLVFQHDMSDPQTIIAELKKDTVQP